MAGTASEATAFVQEDGIMRQGGCKELERSREIRHIADSEGGEFISDLSSLVGNALCPDEDTQERSPAWF